MAAPITQLLCKKLIKPSLPTPSKLRHYKLSITDQLVTPCYMPISLFYPKHSFENSNNAPKTSLILEKSLSNLLTTYYPFAGRLVENVSIDCNDKGAIFKETKFNCSMFEILEQPLSIVEGSIFPDRITEDGSLVVAQLNHFDCGGKALSLCVSHKLGDALTMLNFASDLATLARDPTHIPNLPPLHLGSSSFPPDEDTFPPSFHVDEQEHVVTRLSLDANIINRLKAKIAAKSDVKNPSRFEIVASVITRLMATSTLSDTFRQKLIPMTVNLRPLINIPQNSVGNFVSLTDVTIEDEEEMKLANLVGKIRKEKLKMCKKFEGLHDVEELKREVLDRGERYKESRQLFSQNDTFFFSSLCNYPIYNLDFGWGRPSRVHFAPTPAINFFVLTDDYSGGAVEVTAAVEEQALSVLNQDYVSSVFSDLCLS